MNLTMNTNPIPLATGSSGGTTNQSSDSSSPQGLNSMFLQLLIAQLQNQDPTSPVDPTQFVTQLAQFSELGEVSSIYSLLQGMAGASGTASSGSGAGGTGNSLQAGTNPIPSNSAASGSHSPIVTSAVAAAQAFAPLLTGTARSVPAVGASRSPLSNFNVPASLPKPTIEGVF